MLLTGSLPPTPAPGHQLLTPLDFVPDLLRGHGFREAHSQPLDGRRTAWTPRDLARVGDGGGVG